MNLGRMAACLAQSLSIRAAAEACVCLQPPGTLGSWEWQQRESLCAVVTSSFHHTSWEIPSSLMLLEVLGGMSAHQQQYCMLAMSCLTACPGFCSCWCHQQPKCGCCLGVGAAAPDKGSTIRLGQMAKQVVFIPAGHTQPGKPRLCISPCVTSPQSHHGPCACSGEHKLLPHPTAISATSTGSPSFYQHGLCSGSS